MKARAEALGRTEAELKSEMAAALGRISGNLTQLIQDLHRVRQQYETGTGARRSQALFEYRALRSRALQYQWYLIVQREAIGIRNHESVSQLYPIPEVL